MSQKDHIMQNTMNQVNEDRIRRTAMRTAQRKVPNITIKEGKLSMRSEEVADFLGVSHWKLLRAIDFEVNREADCLPMIFENHLEAKIDQRRHRLYTVRGYDMTSDAFAVLPPSVLGRKEDRNVFQCLEAFWNAREAHCLNPAERWSPQAAIK